jgi:PAS domain S-box-containing protein
VLIRSVPSRVATTIALPALALLISQLFHTWLELTFESLFIAASAITAWLCGTRYGFVCVLLSALALDYFFLGPANSLELPDARLRVKFFLFLAASSIVIGLIHYARRAKADLAASEERYRSLAELIPFGGWMADARGNMVRLSESFLKTFEVTMEECRGLGWMRLLDEPDRHQVIADWRECMRSGYFWDYEYRLRAPSGNQYVVLSRGIPAYGAGGTEKFWVGIHLDITERELSAQQRIEQARNIARFNAELEQFAYVSAHDLQEPLRMISSYVQLLSRRYKGKLDPDADTYIGYAVEGAERLQTLLQDLLELQQVGKGGKPVVVAPLALAVNKACANLSLEIARYDAEITAGDLPTFEYEEQSYIQLFGHLFENALKYRREGVRPQIHVSAERLPKANAWEIAVKDNGIGIPAEFTEKIFDVFQRLHPRSMYQGTGIGLAICKKIVEVNGGHIRVESTVGEGSTFYFTIPLSRVRAA